MNHLDNLLERNQQFAAEQSSAGSLMPSLSKALPNVKAIVIGCADMRVDPAHILKLQPGEAVVIRAEVQEKFIDDPRSAVAVDVAALRAVPALPAAWLLSGIVYNVATGLAEIIIPPAPVRAE